MGHFEIPVNSNIFVTVEYVVFDLVLAICVCLLTSKLVGLYNCYDALKNRRTCHLCEDTSAPLFETGIMSTKKEMFYGMALLRILSWILIFSTNLLVRGRSELLSNVHLTTRGGFSMFDSSALLEENGIHRIACRRRLKNSTYYGEIRNGTCEMNHELFIKPPIEFSFKYQHTLVSTIGCINGNSSYQHFRCNSTTTPTLKASVRCVYNETNGVLNDDVCYINGSAPHTSCFRSAPREQEENVKFKCGGRGEYLCWSSSFERNNFSTCDNAVVSCRRTQRNGVQIKNCAGLVNKGGVTLMCKNLRVGNLQNHGASCKIARGLDWNITDWLQFYGSHPLKAVTSVVAVAYGSGDQIKQVKTYTIGYERSFTQVRYSWIGVLTAKVIMVLVLFIVCEALSRRYRVFAIANDELRLYSLIKITVGRLKRDNNLGNGADNRLRVKLDNGVIKLYNVDEARITGDRM